MPLTPYFRMAALVGLGGLVACAGASKSVEQTPSTPAVAAPSASRAPEREPTNPADLFGDAIAGCGRGDAAGCHRLASRVIDGASPREFQRYTDAFRAGCERGVADACAGLALAEARTEHSSHAEPSQATARLESACKAGSSIACAARIEERVRATHDDAEAKRALIAEAASTCERLGGSVCFTAGSYSATGDGVPKDMKEARRWFDRGCQTGSAYACFYQAMVEAEEGDAGAAARARPLFEKACAADVDDACMSLAVRLFKAGQETDHAKALSLRSCHLGNADACDFLALSHDGANLQEPEKAYATDAEREAAFERYCVLGGAESCIQLAFARGGAAEQSGDLEKMEPVLTLLQQGCSRGSARGCNVLGHVVKDALAACDKGNAAQCLVAGFAYAQGISMPRVNGPTVAKDEAKAKAAFQKACEGGRAEGCRRVH